MVLLIRFNLNAQYETHNRIDNLKPEEKRRAINIMENILKKKKAIDRINNSNIDQTRKVKMINSVINQINQLEAAHGEVLNRAQIKYFILEKIGILYFINNSHLHQ